MSNSVGPSWRLVTIAAPGDAATQAGIQVIGEDAVRVPDFLAGVPSVSQVVQRWEEFESQLQAHDPRHGDLAGSAALVNPLQFPRKVLCSGPNYHDHLAEMGQSDLGEQWSAYFFFKPPTTTLIGPVDDILVSANWAENRIDWEGELAVVLGVGGRHIAVEHALEHVAGYAVANDISLRGPHRRNTPATPFVWDWVASKASDNSLPIGPGLVPAWLVPNPQNLPIRTWVNADLRQDGNTANMVLDIARLIADASKLTTLEPGDVIVTGTPAGVGAGRGIFLAPGDTVDVEIPSIGRLTNTIALRPDDSALSAHATDRRPV